MTFSIVARCRDTGMFGVAVASSSPAVAARCAYAQAGVGAVASQNVTDPPSAPRALALMAARRQRRRGGRHPRPHPPAHADYRQLLAVDAAGTSAIHSGPERPRRLGRGARHRRRLRRQPARRRPTCPAPWSTAFQAAPGHLGDRLRRRHARRPRRRRRGRPDAFRRPEAGPRGPLAGRRPARRLDDDDPIERLAALWDLYKPPARRLRHPRPRPPRRPELRRARRRIGRAAPRSRTIIPEA